MADSQFSYALPYPAARKPVMARNVVSTSQPLAAQAGLSVLARGGNAIDAAIAAAAVLTVVEPTGNGLGSDAFAIIWDGNELHGLNASGRSPAGWTPERFAGQDKMPARGWESVTVPGAVSAWVELSNKFGKLDFETLIQPAIGYAEDGFIVSPVISELWAKGAALLKEQPGFAETFMRDGRTPRAGEVFRNAPLAATLKAIAATKGEAFYRGEIAQKVAAFAAAHGAALTAEDLAAHTNDWCGTISMGFGDVSLHEIPPNGQGIVALMALGILGELPVGDFGPDDAQSLHYQIEAIKLAMADTERYVSDPDYMKVSVEQLLDRDYLKSRARLIDPVRAQEFGAGAPTAGGTVYLTVADASGMMVSYIQSNYSGFGSGVAVPGTGIHLQNRGLGFTLEPGHPNQVGPRKRPFHTIIPGFLMKGNEPLMSFGVMGGPMQAQGHLQMVVRTQLYGQNPQAASDAPRWRYVSGLNVAIETTMAPEAISGLEERGHQITREEPDTSFGFGGAQLIHRLDEGYVAGSDHRKDGMAVGF
ncbi:gamma-glutamyltransferase [Nitratireductor aestuarii]|uniref:Gamma-glutamyltransferase n=1 Tax=Nitratireductor aestuarii TaxID=1735103 RepID=A0A916W9Q5_9HYPH|nr:gamma-glutamyltransferase family protein [Nitratireductor aestuarii]GGA79626.1 gamma-glutamyltransferase [Nitratireductor aestuarii]